MKEGDLMITFKQDYSATPMDFEMVELLDEMQGICVSIEKVGYYVLKEDIFRFNKKWSFSKLEMWLLQKNNVDFHRIWFTKSMKTFLEVTDRFILSHDNPLREPLKVNEKWEAGVNKRDVANELLFYHNVAECTNAILKRGCESLGYITSILRDTIEFFPKVSHQVGENQECLPVGEKSEFSEAIKKGEEPQQEELKTTKSPGRPKRNGEINCVDENKLHKIHKALEGRKGKDAMLVLVCAQLKGWIDMPSYSGAVKEFGDIFGTKTNYNNYKSKDKHTPEEIEGMNKRLDLL